MSFFEWLEWIALLAGFALLHSLWQTTLAGTVVVLIERIRGGASARLRYAASLTLYLSLPVLAVVTAALLSVWRSNGPVTESGPPVLAATWVVTLVPILGLIWAAGIVAGVARLAGGALLFSHLTRGSREVDTGDGSDWVPRLGVGVRVPVRVSDRVHTPTVSGLRRPTIFFPRALFDALDRDEVDAIVAHELSHVRRRDPIANAAQRTVSAILFFHPVAAWMSRAIERAREECCDDLVTRIGVPRRTYARALARVALGGNAAAVAGLGAGDGNVAARVHRILAPGAGSRRGSVPLTLILLLGTFAASASGTRILLPATVRAASQSPAWQARTLSELKGRFDFNAVDPAGEFTLAVEDGRAVSATISGAPLPPYRIRQRGARVTLRAESPGETFSVTLLPGGRIEWLARATGSD